MAGTVAGPILVLVLNYKDGNVAILIVGAAFQPRSALPP
jgi:hypothetical protein